MVMDFRSPISLTRLAGAAALLAIGFIGTGCQSKYLYQSRYIPRPSELTWDDDHEQLPWRPPAIEQEEHYSRNQRQAKTRFPAELQYSVASGKNLFLQTDDE